MQKERTKKSTTMQGWRPKDGSKYQEELDTKLRLLSSCGDLGQQLERKCNEIERILIDVAEKCREGAAEHAQGTGALTGDAQNRLHDLIAQRRFARRAGLKSDVKDVSKKIQKEVRAIANARKTERVRKVLEEFKDLQRIANIRGNGKTICIGTVVDKEGEEKTGADDIAEVFADFFESL